MCACLASYMYFGVAIVSVLVLCCIVLHCGSMQTIAIADGDVCIYVSVVVAVAFVFAFESAFVCVQSLCICAFAFACGVWLHCVCN